MPSFTRNCNAVINSESLISPSTQKLAVDFIHAGISPSSAETLSASPIPKTTAIAIIITGFTTFLSYSIILVIHIRKICHD